MTDTNPSRAQGDGLVELRQAATRLGYTDRRSADVAVYRGTFPLPTYRQRGRRGKWIRRSDLDRYLAGDGLDLIHDPAAQRGAEEVS